MRATAVSACLMIASAAANASDIQVGETVVLGPFLGHYAPLDPANEGVEFYGTDLGWTYEHQGKLQFLFGDTWTNIKNAPVTPTHDDTFGTIDLRRWSDSKNISVSSIPRVQFGKAPDGKSLAVLDYGLPAEGLKTPIGGFSNGEREFAVFITGKPKACKVDADCGSGLVCETSVGYLGERPDRPAGLTLACEEGSNLCNADTLFDASDKPVPGSGVCADRTSSMWTDSSSGRTSASTMEQWVAVRDTADPAKYQRITNWHTNKFINTAFRTVDDFDPARSRHDYRNLATTPNADRKVFMWGRPEFIGVNARKQTLGMYFAYADLPSSANPRWQLHYFTGVDVAGKPKFSGAEKDAVAIDLDSRQPGVQANEAHDVVAHMSVAWLEPIRKWVMFYGGGTSNIPSPPLVPECGLVEISARTECKHVDLGNGAIRMRTADNPWGPWSPPEDIFVGGDAHKRPTEKQFASGGVLHHPACVGEKCESRSPGLPVTDYGWLYGSNIVEQWTSADAKGVDVIWMASTWNPYRIVLLKTRLDKSP